MSWETIIQADKLNQAYVKVWQALRKNLCPVCELTVVRDTSGRRGCTFCEWTESNGVVQQ